MSTQHTPGPWMRTHGSGRYYIKTDKQSIATVFSSNGEFGCPTNPTSEQASANARLIAAAPELLALLIELVDMEGPQPGTSAWGDKARAAIAKATGGAA